MKKKYKKDKTIFNKNLTMSKYTQIVMNEVLENKKEI